MKRTVEHYGAAYLLTISNPILRKSERNGAAKAVSCEVNRLFNEGFISTPPEDYDPTTDISVTVTTNRKRLLKVGETHALSLLEQDAELRNFLKGHEGYVMTNAAKELAPTIAAQFLRSFERVQSVYDAKRSEPLAPFGQGDTHESIGWNNSTVS